MNDQTLADLWYGALGRPTKTKKVPLFVRGNAIADRWAADPFKYGAVLGPERDQEDGAKVQMFTNMAIRWHPDEGASDVG